MLARVIYDVPLSFGDRVVSLRMGPDTPLTLDGNPVGEYRGHQPRACVLSGRVLVVFRQTGDREGLVVRDDGQLLTGLGEVKGTYPVAIEPLHDFATIVATRATGTTYRKVVVSADGTVHQDTELPVPGDQVRVSQGFRALIDGQPRWMSREPWTSVEGIGRLYQWMTVGPWTVGIPGSGRVALCHADGSILMSRKKTTTPPQLVLDPFNKPVVGCGGPAGGLLTLDDFTPVREAKLA